MKKTTVFIVFISVLILFVSCNPDSILRAGNILSGTGSPVLGACVTDEKTKEVADLLKDLAVLSDSNITTASEKADQMVLLIQQIKSSPKMIKMLEKELQKPVFVRQEVYEGKKNIVDATNIFFDLAAHFEEKIDSIIPLADAVASATDIEDLRKLLSGTDIAPLLEDDFTANAILSLQLYMGDIKDYSGKAGEFVEKYLGPFMGFITELDDASEKMLASMSAIEADSSVSGLSLMNGVLGEKLVNDVIGSVVVILMSESELEGTDVIVETMSNLLKDLDSIAVINSDIQFSSLDSLTSTVLNFVGGIK